VKKGRAKRLIENLEVESCDAYLSSNPIDIKYYADIDQCQKGWLMIDNRERIFLFIEEAWFNGAKTMMSDGCDLTCIKMGRSLLDYLLPVLQANNIKKVAFEDLPVSAFNQLKEGTNVELRMISNLSTQVRRRKDEEEIELLRRATEIADAGMKTARSNIHAGVKELDIAAEINHTLRKLGAGELAFETQVNSGWHSLCSPYSAIGKLLEKGEMIVVDIGLKYLGYWGDLTRTFVLGDPREEQLKILKLVLEAQKHAIKRLGVGTSTREVDAEARRVFARSGYESYFTHHTGHGLGLGGDLPRLVPHSEDVIQVNDSLTIEPGIYVPGIGGARIEDDIVITEEKVEILTSFPKDLETLIIS